MCEKGQDVDFRYYNQTEPTQGLRDEPLSIYHHALRQELEARLYKLRQEQKLIEDTLMKITPEIEAALMVANNLNLLGMRSKF